MQSWKPHAKILYNKSIFARGSIFQKQKKYNRGKNVPKMTIYGRNPVKEKLKNIKSGTLYLQQYITNQFIVEITKKAKSMNIEIINTTRDQLDKLSENNNHQGVVLECEESYDFIIEESSLQFSIENVNSQENTILILDGIQDVGNLGAIIRSAAMFGVSHIILPKNNSAPITPVVIKRSAGAIFSVKICYVTNISRTIKLLKDSEYWIYGTDFDGKNIKTVEYPAKTAFVLGDEGTGIRKLVKENCDEIITIPTTNVVDSLNLSVSGGIALFDRYCKISVKQ